MTRVTIAQCVLCGLAFVCAFAFCRTVGKAAEPAQPDPGEARRIMREEYLAAFQRSPLNTTPEDARFLRIMVNAARAKRGIEVGTATGFGAISMGMAFERTGGHLITIDINADMVRRAREHIKNVGLEKTVTCMHGDALAVLPTLEDTYDFLFLDAVKSDYLKYLRAIEPRLAPGAVIVADNVIASARAMRDFLDAMAKDPNYDMQIIRCSDEKNDGMAVIHKAR